MALLDLNLTGPNPRTSLESRWLQGRTAYGGASAAFALAAVKARLPELAPLRSAQLAFVGPLAGELTAHVSELRRGKSTAFIACDVHSDTGLGLRALFQFTAGRASALTHPAPAMPGEQPGRDVQPNMAVSPPFLANFQIRDAGEQAANEWRRWFRLRDRETDDSEIALLLYADALPPAAMHLLKPTGPISTTTWQVNVVGPLPNPDSWWLLRSEARQVADGGSSQDMWLWREDGTAVAHAIQSVALFY